MIVTVLPEKPQAEPVWDVALLFPNQGHWSVDDFVALTNSTNRLVEFQVCRSSDTGILDR
jgi:hypothetical protein